jgi:hypothetical protein
MTADQERTLRKIRNRGRRGLPAPTGVNDARNVHALRATGAIRWDDRRERWVALEHDAP